MKKILVLAVLIISILGGCYTFTVEKTEDTEIEKVISPKKIQFPSIDGLLIDALVYEIDKDAPVILLCHQARFNKYEYEGIAEKLNERGFNCIAIDQRSGGSIVTSVNETTLRALAQAKPIDYLDAEQDILAAINYASKKYNKPIILWGSSYSSTLALYFGIQNKDVSAVVSFSPGNYFAEQKGNLTELLRDFEKPMFITSSNSEIKYVDELLKNHKLNDNQVHFKPAGAGHHGSRALWNQQTGGEEYWKAVDAFLINIKQ